MARLIGQNNREAIDFIQDTLVTTRPIAEMVFESLIVDRAAMIGDSGIILFEDDDDLETREQTTRKSFDMKSQKRVRFHNIRKFNQSRQTKAKKIQFDYNNADAAADGMIQKEP